MRGRKTTATPASSRSRAWRRSCDRRDEFRDSCSGRGDSAPDHPGNGTFRSRRSLRGHRQDVHPDRGDPSPGARVDPAASSELANRVWNDWWKLEVEQRPNGAIARSLREGLAVGRVDEEKASSLSQIARALYNERTRLDDARLPRAEVASMVPLFER